MPASTMDILVTLDENYLPPLQVMLTSLHINNPEASCRIYLLHRGIGQSKLESLGKGLGKMGYNLCPILVDEKLFEKAPATAQYPQEMYYRLLAAHLLPVKLNRILYLDPDLLVINSIKPLWNMDLKDNLFAAAAHTGKTELANNVNKLRLGTEHKYFNSGVLVLDLVRARRQIVPEEIFSFVEKHSAELILPDQDILNQMYGKNILELDDFIWNYDARNFSTYYMRSTGKADMPWVMKNTAILHFCGKAKPWKPFYRHRFGVLYQHYMQLARRWFPLEDNQ